MQVRYQAALRPELKDDKAASLALKILSAYHERSIDKTLLISPRINATSTGN